MPRSGTTLTEQILSSHKNVYGAGELGFLKEAIDKTLSIKNNTLNLNEKNLTSEVLQEIRNSIKENKIKPLLKYFFINYCKCE